MSKCLEGHLTDEWLRLQKLLAEEIAEGGKSLANHTFTRFDEQQWRAILMRPFFDAKTCLEYGAGSGYLCRALREAGFKADYKIIDIPELWPVQKAYFDEHGIEGVEWLNEIEEVDLVIAHFSISEAPFSWRDEIFSWHPKYFHILYQTQHTPPEIPKGDWGRNVLYFDKLEKKKENYMWVKNPYDEHFLLIGTRK